MTDEKLGLRVAVVDELLAGLREQFAGLERSALVTRGGVAAAEAVLRSLQGVQQLVERDLSEGVLSSETYAVVKGYMKQESLVIQRVHNSLRDELPAIKHRLEGVNAAVSYLENYKQNQIRAAERAVRDEEEEDAYRADLAERLRPSPPVEAPPAEVLQAEPEPTKRSARKERAPRKAPSSPKSPPTQSCSHCGQNIKVPTGTNVCSPCVSYKNRHGELPPPEVVSARGQPCP